MAPKDRTRENRKLPTNWRIRRRGSGQWTVFYRVPQSVRHLWDGKGEYVLGRGKSQQAAINEAHATYGNRMRVTGDLATMRQLLDRYEAEVVPTKAPSTQRSNRYSIQRLRAVFDNNLITQIRSHHVYQYRDHCAKQQSKKKANLDLEVLSHSFTKAFEWGAPSLIEHPIKGKVNKFSLQARSRYVTDDELAKFLETAGDFLRVYIPLKMVTGMDKGDLLSIKITDIKADGLYTSRKKTRGKLKVYPFDDEHGQDTGLRAVIDAVRSYSAKHIKVGSIWLFCTTQGQPYLKEDGMTSGFDSIWQRAMRRAHAAGLESRFTEHDLRAKVASDAEDDERARQLMSHTNVQITRTTYRRKADVVRPTGWKK